MSDVQASPTFRQQLAGRWQVPLMVISLAALAAGIWRLRPEIRPPEFEAQYAHAVALHKAELYPEAAAYVESLLSAPDRTEPQRRRLNGLLAQVLFDHESGNIAHGPTNPTRILNLTEAALAPGERYDARTSHMRALAQEWLRKPELAIAEYQAAIDSGITDPWPLRKRILDIRRSRGEVPEEELLGACRTFIDAQGVSDALAYWAAEQTVETLAGQRKFKEAEQFLIDRAGRFEQSGERRGFEYLQALAAYRTGRRDEAELMLRALRDALTPSDPVYARAGLLLGRMLLDNERPEYALAFFEEVLAQVPTGPLRWSAGLGRAEAQDALEHDEDALAGYNEAILTAIESPYDSLFDVGPVSQGTAPSSISKLMSGRWRLPNVTAYLRTVARRAELTLELGKAALARADAAGAPADDPERQRALSYLIKAGDHYLALAGLVMLDPAAAAEITLTAADAFDLAGERARTAEVLERFVHDQPESPQVPGALLRLGETYQAIGAYDRAIETYQRNLIKFPRTPSAIASLVPLADCFLWISEPEKAEQTLLRLVDHRPDDPVSLVTPAATQFRDALFRLGDLYHRQGNHEKAISRYQEAIERYPDDPRVERVRFMLAEANRHSAERIREDLKQGEGLAFMDELSRAQVRRLERARELYTQVIEKYGGRPPGELPELDRLCLMLSYLYAADSVFELSQTGRVPTSQPFADALSLYEQAAWACAAHPIAMSAYVQMINCHLRMGRQERARMVLQRARWVLRNIPDRAFEEGTPGEDRAYWEQYLTWLENTPTLTATQPAAG